MSETPSPNQVEFIRLNGLTVRVTSWRPGTETGTFDLVTITRGSRDAETLDALFRNPRLELEIGTGPARPVTAVTIDRRTVGEGQAGITRYAVTLADADAATEAGDASAPPAPTLEERVAALEADVQSLRALIHTHVNGTRH